MTVFTIWPDDVRWRRVSPRLFVVHLAGYLATIAVLGAAAATIWYAVGWPQVWTVLVTVNLLIVIRLAFVPRSLRSWGYAERADDLLISRGVLFREETVVPYGRMQLVEVTSGPVERHFGLASVQLHTAAAATDACIPGLDPAEAERLRDRLTELGEARSAGL